MINRKINKHIYIITLNLELITKFKVIFISDNETLISIKISF
nr:MAG TPA: hypothetical protein [Caudoviricetes sp.]